MEISMFPEQRARRGDIAALVHPHDGRTDITLGIVTSVTRDEMVKAWDEPLFTRSEPRPLSLRLSGADRVLVMPAARFDVARAMTAYRKHVYADHDMIKPFESEDEVRGFLASFPLREGSDG